MANVAKPRRTRRRMRLSGRWERSIVREVVRSVRGQAASSAMRLVADEVAVEVLAEEHGIKVPLRTVQRIAS